MLIDTLYASPSSLPCITSVETENMSFPILCGSPTACMLLRNEAPGPVTGMFRALPCTSGGTVHSECSLSSVHHHNHCKHGFDCREKYI